MNQEEDVPARVTRGALRRRSVDQDATPQKPAGGTVSGTPKKTNSTTKKATALNAIQESEGRPSTPIVGRTTRRRMSETFDAPPSLPNKLVQNLKEAETTNTEHGRRSRNTSLTEENLNELNATYEGSSMSTLTTRSRTPARLRASHEVLTSSSSPQPVATGVRRSTRRNSVTSDDGNSSVQSLPVTVSKLSSSVRALKDDTIIEEDDREERAESVSSDTSARQTRAQSALSTASVSVSPRSTPASPVSGIRVESTPPRGSKTPRVSITPLSLSKVSPRFKNVSFSEDSKRDDHQSSLPKTPTSVSKEMFVVVEDLRNSELKGVSSRVTAAGSVTPKTNEAEGKRMSVNASPKGERMDSEKQPLDETVVSISKGNVNDSTSSMAAVENGEECAEDIATTNDVSGIEVLESSVKATTDITVMETNDTVNDSTDTVDQSLSEGNNFSRAWSQPVRRSATKGIDEYSVRKQEEQERLEQEKQSLQKSSQETSFKTCSSASKQKSTEMKEDEENVEELEEEEDEPQQRNEFADDEALEVEDYQSCDSIDSDLRQEMEENEIPDHGEDLGSEDTEENDEQEDYEDGNDSWIVSDGEEVEPTDEDRLLQSSNDEALTANESAELKQPKTTTRRRRIVDPVDDSDEEEKPASPAKSPKRNTINSRRSATPALGDESENLTPAKKSDYSEGTDVIKPVEESVETTPNVENSLMETSVVGEDMETSLGVPTTPTTVDKTSPKTDALKSPSPVNRSASKKEADDGQNSAVSAEDLETKDSSMVMFKEEADKMESTDQQNQEADKMESTDQQNQEAENGSDTSVSSNLQSRSPTKTNMSRKSFPANSATIADMSPVVVDSRKSLPANTKLQTIEKTDEKEMEEELPGPDNNGSVVEIDNLEQDSEEESSSPTKKAHNESFPVEITLDQPTNDAPGPGSRKSMPPVSLISAQFYLGTAKTRNTIGGGDTSAVTSTPKPPNQLASSAKSKKDKNASPEKKKTTESTSVLLNPFALAKEGKMKSRVSLDSSTVRPVQQTQSAVKKTRLSLPCKLIKESDSPSKTGTSVSGFLESESDQQPEPMEVDEVPDEENAVNGEAAKAQNGADEASTDGDDDSVQEVRTVETKSTKVPKPKAKALEDYDLANILSRCNEFVREDKERKKQLASVLRKKKEEKKKLRELEKQQELEAAKTAANASAADKDDPNSANASTGNDSIVQGEESQKKKKKRKPKKVNYLLEEMAEIKKDRLEQALRHKLEVIERRKQRKKDRLLEKKKQQDKENGNDGNATVAAGGIGAKLEKMKKKHKTKQLKEKSNVPEVQVALSAFAAFHQIPNKQMELPSSAVAPVDGKQIKPKESHQLAASPVEKKQDLKPTERATKPTKPVDTVEKSPTETSNAKKKQSVAAQQPPEEALLNGAKKSDLSPSLSIASGDATPEHAGKMSKKQKKKLAAAAKSSVGVSDNNQPESNETPVASKVTAEPCSSIGEKSKDKKRKEQVTELATLDADSGTVTGKQKKSKKIKQNEAAGDHITAVQAKRSSAMDEVRTEIDTVSKLKKDTKKLMPQSNGDAVEGENVTIPQPRKKPASGVQEPPAAIVPAKKRKRDQQADSSVGSTPRPAKHTKLRVLQRIESGGFFEESVTPDKLRMKRNFGFDERQATPAKQLGFRVSSLIPTGQDELRGMAAATSSKKSTKDGRKASKFGDVVTERNASLPLPVWTSSGVFLELAADGGVDNDRKKSQKEKPISSTAANSGYIQLNTQGKGDFSLKKLRPGTDAEKPHRVDPTTTSPSVLNFKRQQLLEKTAHLRDKKKSHRV